MFSYFVFVLDSFVFYSAILKKDKVKFVFQLQPTPGGELFVAMQVFLNA